MTKRGVSSRRVSAQHSLESMEQLMSGGDDTSVAEVAAEEDTDASTGMWRKRYGGRNLESHGEGKASLQSKQLAGTHRTYTVLTLCCPLSLVLPA